MSQADTHQESPSSCVSRSACSAREEESGHLYRRRGYPTTYCHWALLGQIAGHLYALEELAVDEVAVEGAKELAAIQHYLRNVHFLLIHLDDVQFVAHAEFRYNFSKCEEH